MLESSYPFSNLGGLTVLRSQSSQPGEHSLLGQRIRDIHLYYEIIYYYYPYTQAGVAPKAKIRVFANSPGAQSGIDEVEKLAPEARDKRAAGAKEILGTNAGNQQPAGSSSAINAKTKGQECQPRGRICKRRGEACQSCQTEGQSTLTISTVTAHRYSL